MGYAPGKGRNKGITGALKCQMESGKVVLFHLFSNFPKKKKKHIVNKQTF